MFELHFIIAIFLIYMLFLFIIAYFVEKNSTSKKLLSSPYIYALSLAIYCTAWTYYGSVGKVSSGGFIFMAVYLGPTLIVFLWPIILRRMIKIKEIYKVTSLADLISARYDKSMFIGAFVSFGAIAGIIPYISIQLKAIIQSIDILLIKEEQTTYNNSADDVGILIVILMAFFTIIFGLRKLDPSERHFGIVFIVAIESVIKLFALLIIGIFVSYFVFDDIESILTLAAQNEIFKHLSTNNNGIDYSNWISITILSMFAVMFLPRQFHISVVENSNVNHIKTAMWVFPLYLFLITLFTIPIALGGSLLDIDHTLNDFYVLTIPMSLEQPILSMIAFIGGFSASTSMIMVTSMAMAIMVSNYLVLPLLELSPHFNFLKRRLLLTRWVIVTLLISLSYVFYLFVSKDNLIVNIGLISFTAILQFAPVIIGGLFWEKANKYGAITALMSGFFIWFYTLIIPQFVKSEWIANDIVNEGLFGLALLKPTQLFGLSEFASIPHAVFWTMFFNIGSFIIVSLIKHSSEQEQKIANDFVHILQEKEHLQLHKELEETINIKEKMHLFENILNQYLNPIKTTLTLKKINKRFELENKETINILELSKIYSYIERVLSGTLGTAGAHNALKKSEIFSEDESTELSNLYANILKKMKISPEEFSKKINYFEEKEKLLKEHYEQLKEKIIERDNEISARKTAEDEIRELNETLEHKVEDRTKQLRNINVKLNQSMIELKKTQDNLIEAEKMASLGELVAGVAHEINTPVGSSLTGITYFNSLSQDISKLYKEDNLSQEDFENFLKKSKELAKSININLEKTAKLVSSFKQVAVDQSSDDKRDFNMCEYIDEILLSLNNITKKTRIKIEKQCPNHLSIQSYPGVFSQVLTNFIINTTIHAYDKKEKGKIEIIINDKETDIELIYKDYGKGIKEENLAKVFNPFFTTNRESGGSGLGLSIIYNLITTKLHGTIKCESRVNEGTTFIIHFPKE